MSMPPASSHGPADADALAGGLRVAVNRMAYALRRPGRHGLTPSRYTALAILLKRGTMRTGDLAAAMAISRPTATRLVDALEEADLIDRAPDPADGRATVVALSEQGQSVIREIRSEATSGLRDNIAALTLAERESLSAALPVLSKLADLSSDATTTTDISASAAGRQFLPSPPSCGSRRPS